MLIVGFGREEVVPRDYLVDLESLKLYVDCTAMFARDFCRRS